MSPAPKPCRVLLHCSKLSSLLLLLPHHKLLLFHYILLVHFRQYLFLHVEGYFFGVVHDLQGPLRHNRPIY